MLEGINFIEVSVEVWNAHIKTFPTLKGIHLMDCKEIEYFFDFEGKVYASITNKSQYSIRKEMYDKDIGGCL